MCIFGSIAYSRNDRRPIVFAVERICRCTAITEVRLIARIQALLFNSIIDKELAYFDEKGPGELTSRLTSDATLLGSANVSLPLSLSREEKRKA